MTSVSSDMFWFPYRFTGGLVIIILSATVICINSMGILRMSLKTHLLLNSSLLILGSVIFLTSCGPTEVSVDVEEVNVEAELNTSITMPESSQLTAPQGGLATPFAIPTPIGLEGMAEALESVSVVSEQLQDTAEQFGAILGSLNDPTPLPKIQPDYPHGVIGLNDLLLIGFIVSEETTSKWSHAGFKNSYIGVVNFGGVDRSFEVLIFDSAITDMSFAAEVTADILLKNGYGQSIDFHENISVSCKTQEICQDLFNSLDEKRRLLRGQ